MDFTSSLIGPENSATPAAPETNAPADGSLSVDKVAELPPVRAVLDGKPAAIYADEHLSSPMAQTIGQNFKKIGELGLAFYHSPNKVMVLFNPSLLSPQDLQAADKAGKLDSVAAPADSFEGAEQTPQTEASAPAPGASQSLTKGLTPRAQSKLAGTRINSLIDDQAPSKRQVPGGGVILNSLLERAR